MGTDRLARAQGGYFEAKQSQEKLIVASGRPYTLVHTTQFFEFIRNITESAMSDGVARVADVRIQPMAADDVAAAVVGAALGTAADSVREHAGPDVFELGELAERELRFRRDDRDVVADPLGTYFGARLHRDDLLPGARASIAPTRFHEWQIQPASIQANGERV